VPGKARLILVGPDGRRIRELGAPDLSGRAESSISWDGLDDRGRPAPSGVYLARLLYNGWMAAERRVVVIR
jgi:hypothetical protein